MPENHSRAGKDVERVSISDKPHDHYQVHHPMTGERLDNGIPILKKVKGGRIVKKSIKYYTVKCPECHIPAKYDSDSEATCPKCGIICLGSDTILEEQIVRDAKAAGRIDGEDSAPA